MESQEGRSILLFQSNSLTLLAWVMVGLDDLRILFQPKWFYFICLDTVSCKQTKNYFHPLLNSTKPTLLRREGQPRYQKKKKKKQSFSGDLSYWSSKVFNRTWSQLFSVLFEPWQSKLLLAAPDPAINKVIRI